MIIMGCPLSGLGGNQMTNRIIDGKVCKRCEHEDHTGKVCKCLCRHPWPQLSERKTVGGQAQ